eukprot:GEMP01063742.1.p1 GENE.GEMP01063742.1~~GEMP01063742.1.p1  ORF type:complete len:239 (+),score=57.15 GEMP01063742.1:509-1225(+)
MYGTATFFRSTRLHGLWWISSNSGLGRLICLGMNLETTMHCCGNQENDKIHAVMKGCSMPKPDPPRDETAGQIRLRLLSMRSVNEEVWEIVRAMDELQDTIYVTKELCAESQLRREHAAELEAGRAAHLQNETHRVRDALLKLSTANKDATLTLQEKRKQLKQLQWSAHKDDNVELKRREQIVTKFQIELQRDLENYHEPLERELQSLRQQYERRLAENDELKQVLDCLALSTNRDST